MPAASVRVQLGRCLLSPTPAQAGDTEVTETDPQMCVNEILRMCIFVISLTHSHTLTLTPPLPLHVYRHM